MKKYPIVFLIISALMALALSLSGCSSGTNDRENKVYTIKLAHESPATHSKGIWAEDFKKYVEEKSGEKIKVELYHQGQLYSSEEAAIQAAINGLIQVAIPSTGYMSTIAPKFQVFDLPMLFKDQDTLYKFEDGEIGKQLLDSLKNKGIVGLGYISNVPLDLFSTTEIEKPADFAGKKIRAHTALLESAVEALGGNPVSMQASELYLGLEQGIVDGAFTTVTFAAPNKYEEVTPYLTRAKISATAYPVVMNLSFWESLPSDLQNVIKDGVAYATQNNRVNLQNQEEKALESLEKGGIKVIELSPQVREEWLQVLKKVYDETGTKIGSDIIEQAKAFLGN